MKACAAQQSADLQFVEQMGKHITHRAMPKHKEFEFITPGIVSLTTSLTSRLLERFIRLMSSHFCTSVNTNKDLCVT